MPSVVYFGKKSCGQRGLPFEARKIRNILPLVAVKYNAAIIFVFCFSKNKNKD
jgi:hypothetical protein